MLPESIAIVVAPNAWFTQIGIYRLTPSGMDTVRNCHDAEMFHYHHRGGTYEDVLLSKVSMERLGLDVIDLRHQV
jgi:hypothetical protein